MSAFLGHDLAQSQQMALTPKMIEELKILQMSNTDLIHYIEGQLIENPLLEMETSDPLEDELLAATHSEDVQDYDPVQKVSEQSEFTEYLCKPQTLSQYLFSQLGERKIPALYRKVAGYLIDNIDEDGYLTSDIQNIAVELKVSVKAVKMALKMIQGFEPDGVGARNLKESLLIQLYKKGTLDKKIKEIILNHLELLAERKYKEISHKTGLSKEQIVRIHELIKCLNPKPGRAFENTDDNIYITPELEIKDINGQFVVNFLNDSVLNLKIADYYKRLVGDEKSSKETNKYIRAKLSKAMEIINAIEQRKRTIINVATCIAEYQAEFFIKGYQYMKPLTMKIVADKVGIHESTVSRTINDKYINTPRGTFDLKFFFSSQADSQSDMGVSANGVKKLILEIIKSENRSRPLSDEQIRKELENRSIQIARRTVAKYREDLDILPAIQRKL